MKTEEYYYAYCPLCPDYHEDADSIWSAKEKLKKHEAEKHKGKEVGTFGKGWKESNNS